MEKRSTDASTTRVKTRYDRQIILLQITIAADLTEAVPLWEVASRKGAK
jgi:hypothetical protein